MEGILTSVLILTPGIAAFLLELRDMWRGKGNLAKAIIFLVLCPIWAVLTHLYSIFNKEWQAKALMLKTMEGFLCAAPQLVLQLSFWMRGTMTSPMELVLAEQFNVTQQAQDANMTVNFGSLLVFFSLFFHFRSLVGTLKTMKDTGLDLSKFLVSFSASSLSSHQLSISMA